MLTNTTTAHFVVCSLLGGSGTTQPRVRQVPSVPALLRPLSVLSLPMAD